LTEVRIILSFSGMKVIFQYLLLNFKSMRFGMLLNQINPTKKSSLSVYVFVDLTLIFPGTFILRSLRRARATEPSIFQTRW